MYMNLFEEILFNVVFSVFPICIYFIYRCYSQLINNRLKNVSLCLALFASLYLCLKYGSMSTNNMMLLFCNIPIVISYIKKKGYLGILLSLLVIIYSYFVFNYNIYVMIIKYLVYGIIYYVTKNKINSNSFISIISVIQGFFISFEYFFVNDLSSIRGIFDIFILVLIIYTLTVLLIYLLQLADNITSLYSEIKVLEKEKKIKESLFKITHEVKNPIAVCKGYLDMLDTNNQDKVNRYIPIIREEIDRSLNIMTDFMQFNRIKLDKELVDINLLLDDVYDSFKLLNKLQNIKLEYIDNEEEIYIEGDYNRLKQVLLNIIKNSSEAIKDKGKIKISSNIFNNKFEIIIEDNGIGMDKETLSKIKEIFYTTKVKGSGIGVSLSNEIIIAHGGSLSYQSELGKGTIAKVTLPIMKKGC